jgi:hypothetical protein
MDARHRGVAPAERRREIGGGSGGEQQFVQAGNLMSYAGDFYDQTRFRLLLDKIFKGFKPSDVPTSTRTTLRNACRIGRDHRPPEAGMAGSSDSGPDYTAPQRLRRPTSLSG